MRLGYGRTGSDPAVHSTSSMKTYNLKWYQRDQQRRHSTKNREAKGTPPSHCSTEQLIQNSSKVSEWTSVYECLCTFTFTYKYIYMMYFLDVNEKHTSHAFVRFEMKFSVILLLPNLFSRSNRHRFLLYITYIFVLRDSSYNGLFFPLTISPAQIQNVINYLSS